MSMQEIIVIGHSFPGYRLQWTDAQLAQCRSNFVNEFRCGFIV